jgi:hypothetical protein
MKFTFLLLVKILGTGAAIIGTAARFEASMNQVRALARTRLLTSSSSSSRRR